MGKVTSELAVWFVSNKGMFEKVSTVWNIVVRLNPQATHTYAMDALEWCFDAEVWWVEKLNIGQFSYVLYINAPNQLGGKEGVNH